MSFVWDVFGVRARDLTTGRFITAAEAFNRPYDDRFQAGIDWIQQDAKLLGAVDTFMEKWGLDERQAERVLSRILNNQNKNIDPSDFYNQVLGEELE